MATPLRLLIVEDNRTDAELMVLELRRKDYAVAWRLAESREEYVAALREPVDVILCDCSLPSFGAYEALAILNENNIDIPLIVVTGSMDDYTASESMRHGATDYILKDRPGRLGQAVGYALEQKQLRLERQKAEDASRELNAILNAVIQSSPVVILPLDLEGKPLIWHAAAVRIFGWTREQALGRRLVVGRGAHQALYSQLCARVKSGETLSNIDLTMRRQGGIAIHLNFSAAPLFNANGQINGMVAIFADVTEHKRLETELLEAQKLESVGRLAGGIAHDFNNMLTAIMGFSELIALRCSLDGDAQTYVEHITSAASKAFELSQQLLTFARRQQIEPRSLNLNELILGIEMILRRLISESIELRITGETDLHSVLVDPGQFEQILVNLVINARDAIEGAGVISIETKNIPLNADFDFRQENAISGQYVLLAVTDTGKGMDEVTRSRVFEPFFTTKGVGKGSGLGLATAYGIVKQARGHISIESAPGNGTTVQIYLPITTRPLDAPIPRVTTALSRGSETILIAEDEPGVRALASETLRTLGYDVLEAANGLEALRVAEKRRMQIALLVTDAVMPEMDGIDLTAKLMELNPGLRVLCATGYSVRTTRTAPNEPAQDGIYYLSKPYLPTELARMVREILDSPGA